MNAMANVRLIPRISLISAFLLVAGCASHEPIPTDAAKREMLSLLMPKRIEIVQPFTRVRSFDDNSTPDGIEILLQAVNALDNPGLMLAGQIRVELYEHVPASGLPKGAQLAQWDVQISTVDQQRTHWNQVTQMYEFRLMVDPNVIPHAAKYVLSVTYLSPLGDRWMDECVIERPTATRPLGGVS